MPNLMVSMKLPALVFGIGDHGFEIVVIKTLGKVTHDSKHLLLANDDAITIVGFRPLLNLVLQSRGFEQVFQILTYTSANMINRWFTIIWCLFLNDGVKAVFSSEPHVGVYFVV